MTNKKRGKKGRFIKGVRYSPKSEFKKGQHWRNEKPFWDKNWLKNEYLKKGRSTGDIALEFGVTDANILYHLKKHDIPRRTVSEARAIKHWGLYGEDNPMFGRTGEESPVWKGGITEERQSVYTSREWKKSFALVWKRDDSTCQECRKEFNLTDEAFHVHHIISFQYEEGRTKINNLVLLCQSCHHWVHSNENINRKWIKEAPHA